MDEIRFRRPALTVPPARTRGMNLLAMLLAFELALSLVAGIVAFAVVVLIHA